MYAELTLLLLIGHMLGDYYLQSDNMAIKKELSFGVLLLHGVLYTLAMLVAILPVYSFEVLIYTLIIAAIHFVIDVFKYILVVDDKYESKMFIIDQLLHLITIFSVLFFMKYTKVHVDAHKLVSTMLSDEMYSKLKMILLFAFIMKPTSVIIRQVLYKYTPINLGQDDVGHKNAGSLIGILERLLITALLFLNQFVVIGFVLTAKSITRYDKITKDPQFSEYYLLGTLLSILMVVVAFYGVMSI